MIKQHSFIGAPFSYERMLELEPAEARRFFILNLFVPVAYDILHGESIWGYDPITSDRAIGFLLGQIRKSVRPVFLEAQVNTAPQLIGGRIEPTFTNIAAIERHYGRVLGDYKPADALIDKAMLHAFQDCLPHEDITYYDISQLPAVAAFSRIDGEFKLTVVVKLKDRVAGADLLTNQDITRTSLVRLSSDHDYRPYNVLTGEWLGLCDPASKTLCESCRKIYNSPEAENAYGKKAQ